MIMTSVDIIDVYFLIISVAGVFIGSADIKIT